MTDKIVLKKLKNSTQGLKVLYIEDEDAVRINFQRYLNNFFTDVEICANGIEALKKYKKNNFDLVISDIKMPLMDGLELSKKIKQLNFEQKIIIISAHNDLSNYMESVKIGIDGYILKPIEYKQLNETLLKTVEQINLRKLQNSYQETLENSVTEKVKELQNQYITDALTKLPNRFALKEDSIKASKQTLILININNFELINNTFGRDLGDQVLIKVASKLQSFSNEEFKLYKLDSDEFAFLTNNISIDNAKKLVDMIRSYFEQNSIEIKSLELYILFSIAIEYGKKNITLKNASIAISRLKAEGKSNLCINEDNKEYSKQQKDNLYWMKQLKTCLKNDQLVPFFQPIVNMKTNEIYKYEALARIVLNNNDIVFPSHFIKAAYFAGLGTKITKVMIDKSLSMIQNSSKSISFNITQEDLEEKYLIDYLHTKTKQYNINNKQITLEILETISADSADKSLGQLKELKTLGYKISIDDFGAEMSNFSRLINLNVDYIKIDGSFIKDIDKNKSLLPIVETMKSFADKIDAKVIAEFIHNESVLQIIKEIDIDYGQGYYISKPLQNINH